MAGISARPLLQIILVLRLRFPEIPNGFDFGDHLAVPQSGCVDISDRVFCDALCSSST
jgi:hypothetical protein